MILKSLVDYYDQLCKSDFGDITQIGWSSQKVSFLIDVDIEGRILNVIPSEDKKGWNYMVPQQVKRSSGVKPNLLCDNSSYILGIDNKENGERAIKCFEASKTRHLSFLGPLNSEAAQAVFRYFERWNPRQALDNEFISKCGVDLLSGANIVFRYKRQLVLSDLEIREAWEKEYCTISDDAIVMTCLVSGQNEPIAKLHPNIKGIVGAQSSGAALVSFNARSFESYGRDEEQGLNAPVGERATFAYTTALNYLLKSPEHMIRLDDMTIVFWATKNDLKLSTLFNSLCGGVTLFSGSKEMAENQDKKLSSIMRSISNGENLNNTDMETPFFVLGLSPNAARVSVRFFLRSTFGSLSGNLMKHYARTRIDHAPFEREYLTPFQLLREIENPKVKNKTTSWLSGSLLKAILSNSNYPESLYVSVLQRIHASQNNEENHIRKITSGRAAIIKAYLLKNRRRSEKEVTVSLNEDRNDAPYVSGRLFAVLEAIQQSANPGINATILNRYFDSASVTPAKVFPDLIKLSYHHLNTLERDKTGLSVHYRKLLGDLIDRLDAFPKRLTVVDQGDFILGYQHQYQDRFRRRNEAADNKNAQDEE